MDRVLSFNCLPFLRMQQFAAISECLFLLQERSHYALHNHERDGDISGMG